MSGHIHDFTGLWSNFFGPRGPQDVHYHVCHRMRCPVMLIGEGHNCDGDPASHREGRLADLLQKPVGEPQGAWTRDYDAATARADAAEAAYHQQKERADALERLIDYAMLLHEHGEAPPGHELATWGGWYRSVREFFGHERADDAKPARRSRPERSPRRRNRSEG